jgi:hypothetical protein
VKAFSYADENLKLFHEQPAEKGKSKDQIIKQICMDAILEMRNDDTSPNNIQIPKNVS